MTEGNLYFISVAPNHRLRFKWVLASKCFVVVVVVILLHSKFTSACVGKNVYLPLSAWRVLFICIFCLFVVVYTAYVYYNTYVHTCIFACICVCVCVRRVHFLSRIIKSCPLLFTLCEKVFHECCVL